MNNSEIAQTASPHTSRLDRMTLEQFESVFVDEEACRRFVLSRRWPGGVACPRCNNTQLLALKARPWHWQCRNCSPSGYRFSLLVGTPFKGTHYPLRTWFRIAHFLLISEPYVTAQQIADVMGNTMSHQAAWYLYHRVREGLQDPIIRRLLGLTASAVDRLR